MHLTYWLSFKGQWKTQKDVKTKGKFQMHLMHQANSILRVRSPWGRPSLMQRPRMSSSIPRVNVAPEPPANRRTFSYSPMSTLLPPYGPSIITWIRGWSTVILCDFSARPSDSALSTSWVAWTLFSLAYALRARLQSPLTRTPRESLRADRQVVFGGAEKIVSGWDSKMRLLKKTRPAETSAAMDGVVA